MKSIFVVLDDGSQSVQIVRWNGPAGDFDYVAQTQGPGISDGDTLKAEIIGTTIRVYINGALVLTGSDSTFATGNPGIGFYLQGGPSETNSDFGFSSITATGGNPLGPGDQTPTPIPGPNPTPTPASTPAPQLWSETQITTTCELHLLVVHQ